MWAPALRNPCPSVLPREEGWDRITPTPGGASQEGVPQSVPTGELNAKASPKLSPNPTGLPIFWERVHYSTKHEVQTNSNKARKGRKLRA